MKKNRIVIVNRGKRTLNLLCERCRVPGKDHFEIRNRKVLKLLPGEYRLKAYYNNRSVVIESPVNDDLHLEDVISPMDGRYMGKRISLSGTGKKFKIACNEQVSIASIIEGG